MFMIALRFRILEEKQSILVFHLFLLIAVSFKELVQEESLSAGLQVMTPVCVMWTDERISPTACSLASNALGR